MTTNELVTKLGQTFKGCLKIVESKNHDYAGNNDAFKNFRYSTLVGVPVTRAVLVRITDKLARVSNLLDKDPKVVGESVEDTLMDLINYSGILMALLEEEREGI